MHFYGDGGGFYIWDGTDAFYNYSFTKLLPQLTFRQLVRILELKKMAKGEHNKRNLDDEDQQKLLGLIDAIDNKDIAHALQTYFNARKS